MGIKEDFNNLQPAKALMVGFVIAVIYYFLIFDKGDLIAQEKAVAQSNIAENSERLKQVANAMNNKIAFQKEVDDLTKNFDELIKYFPVDLDMNNMLYQVRKKLEATNNKIDSLKKGDARNHRFEGYNEVIMDIESQGGFHDIMNFFADLTTLDRVVDFVDLELESNGSTDETSQIKLKLILSVFSQDSEKPRGGGKKGG